MYILVNDIKNFDSMPSTIIMEETSDNDYKELLEICQLTVAVPENQPHSTYCCK